jgi:short subunit dehydrogenase-like uncharacterized protein
VQHADVLCVRSCRIVIAGRSSSKLQALAQQLGATDRLQVCHVALSLSRNTQHGTAVSTPVTNSKPSWSCACVLCCCQVLGGVDVADPDSIKAMAQQTRCSRRLARKQHCAVGGACLGQISG